MCSYGYPEGSIVSHQAKNFISKMLQRDPKHRSTVEELLSDEFLACNLPQMLPTATLACAPNAAFMRKFIP